MTTVSTLYVHLACMCAACVSLVRGYVSACADGALTLLEFSRVAAHETVHEAAVFGFCRPALHGNPLQGSRSRCMILVLPNPETMPPSETTSLKDPASPKEYCAPTRRAPRCSAHPPPSDAPQASLHLQRRHDFFCARLAAADGHTQEEWLLFPMKMATVTLLITGVMCIDKCPAIPSLPAFCIVFGAFNIPVPPLQLKLRRLLHVQPCAGPRSRTAALRTWNLLTGACVHRGQYEIIKFVFKTERKENKGASRRPAPCCIRRLVAKVQKASHSA
jgi:hypothetical protein